MDQIIKTLQQKNISILIDNKVLIDKEYCLNYSKLRKPRFENLNKPVNISITTAKKKFCLFSILKHFIKKGYSLKVLDSDILLSNSYLNRITSTITLKGVLI